MINDILRLSQLDSVEECVDTEPVDLYEMALNCQDMLEMQANKHQVVVRVKGKSEVVQANRRMMDELIYNLCDNAIRYNRVGGSVNVTIGEEAQHPFVSVKDTGIGMSDDFQKNMFDRRKIRSVSLNVFIVSIRADPNRPVEPDWDLRL